MLISNRLQFEQQLRDIKNRSRDEEVKKVQSLTKSLQAKLKANEDSKDNMNRKIQQLLRALQDRDTRIMQL